MDIFKASGNGDVDVARISGASGAGESVTQATINDIARIAIASSLTEKRLYRLESRIP
jgi:hypothetical protein